MKMIKAVGYCENLTCEDYVKGIFLLNQSHNTSFYCPRCRQRGFKETESRILNPGDVGLWREVQFEYNFDPLTKLYTEKATVTDESLPLTAGWLLVKSPLVKTETRALKLAEGYLSALCFRGTADTSFETILDLNQTKEDFKKKLVEFERMVENSHYFRYHTNKQ